METAYLFMLGTLALAVVCGFVIPRRFVAITLPCVLPLLTLFSKFKGGGAHFGEALLFISPFLVAGAFVYGFISYVGVRLGRWLRPAFRVLDRREVPKP